MAERGIDDERIAELDASVAARRRSLQTTGRGWGRREMAVAGSRSFWWEVLLEEQGQWKGPAMTRLLRTIRDALDGVDDE